MKAKNTLKKVWYLLKETATEFVEDNGMKHSAALSYYTIFSLPPLLIIIINLSGYFFGAEAARGEIFGQINGLVGNDAASQIQEIIKNVKLSGSNAFVTTLGIIILVIGASGVFVEIQDSINIIWGIRAKPKKGLIRFIKNRLLSFSMIGSVGFLLMVGLITNTIMDVLSQKFAAYLHHESITFFYALNILTVFLITALLFTVIFKTLPDGKINLRDCVTGASFTALLFMIGKFLIGAYLGKSVLATWYGAAGSIILLLVWVYYSAIILYFGAEFTKVYAHTHGEKITPNEYSVKVISREVEIENK